MLSRVACAPRVCLSCRLGLLQARAARGGPSLPPPERWIRRRHDGRDPIIHSKERIEALISGKLVESPETKGGPSKSGKKSRKGSRWKKPKGKSKDHRRDDDDDDDLPDWGFSFPASRMTGGEQARIAQQESQAQAPSPLHFAQGVDAMLDKQVQDEPRESAYSIAQEATRQLLEEQEAEEEEPIDTTEQVSEKPIFEQSVDEETVISEPVASPREELEADEVRPPRKRHVILGKGLVRSATVGKQALGRPLDALIVKNPNRLRWPPKPIRALAPENPAPADLDWQAFMPQEEEPSELMDEAVRNIESLRPADAAPLSMRDFDGLRAQLVDGFTYNQLSSYFYRQLRQMDTTRKRLVESLKKEAARYDWVIEQTNWEPSEPNHWERSTPKVNQALMIMQALWKIEVKEQVEGLGRVRLWLRPDVFKLISGPSSSALRTLATQYLYRSNNERIEGSMDESRLDIIARKSIVPVFLARLDEIVGSITSQVVSAENLDDDDLTPGLLQEVARITSSLVEYNEETAELHVSWVANDPQSNQRDAADQTETPADTALRLLTKRQRGLPPTLQVMSPSQQSTPTYRLVPHQRETRSMSWREKLQSWCRYVSPIGRQPAEAAEPAAPLRNGISLPSISIDASQPHTQEVLTATFGHILHETATEQDRTAEAAAAEQDTAAAAETQAHAALRGRPRILSPVVPHPAALTPLTVDAATPISQQTSIVLHFAPSPAQPASSKFAINEATPSLRLTLPLHPDADPCAPPLPADSSLHAVVPRLAHDVLLPGGAVDAHIAQHALVPLPAADQGSLAQLLAACDFDLAAGRLRAPARASFSVPGAWLSTPAGRRSRSKKPVSVGYRFAGLEVRRAVEAQWQGHTLVYTSTEAGQHGGQRQELSLRAGLPGREQGGALDERERAEFLALVEGVARGEHFSWHEGFKAMREVAEGDELVEEAVAEQEGLDVPFAPETDPGAADEDARAAVYESGSTVGESIQSEDEGCQALDSAETGPTESSAPETSSAVGAEDHFEESSPACSKTE